MGTEISDRAIEPGGDPQWRTAFWLPAALVPAIFFAFEAFMVSLYPATRAPNVSAATQIVIMGVFFALWVGVPRIIWELVPARAFALVDPIWRRRCS